MSIEQLFEEAAELERLFEEEPQVHDIDELIQAVGVDKRALSEGRIVKEVISPGRAELRDGEARSMKDESQLTPRSRPKPIVRRHSAGSIARHATMTFITKLFGRKILAGRCRG